MQYELVSLGVFLMVFGLMYLIGGILSLIYDSSVPSPTNNDQWYVLGLIILSGLVLFGVGLYYTVTSLG